MNGQRKLDKARQKAQKANERLAKYEATASAGAPPAPAGNHQAAPDTSQIALATRPAAAPPPNPAGNARTKRRRGRRALVALASVVVVAGIAAAAWFTVLEDRFAKGDDEHSATVAVNDVRGVGEAIVVSDGTISAAALATDPAVGDRVTSDGPVVMVTTPIVVDKGGRLDLDGAELRLLSDATTSVKVQVQGGRLVVNGSTITSWDPATNAADTEIKDGRASVLVTDGGRAEVSDSSLVSLGYEETDRHGFSFTGGSTSGFVKDTRIDDGHVGVTASGNVDVDIEDIDVVHARSAGVELAGTTGVDVTGSTIQDGAGDGILVRGGSADISIKGNDVFGNAGSGLSLAGSSGRITVSDNLSHRNLRAGITVSNTRDVKVSGNQVYGNATGITMSGGNSNADVNGNEVGGNDGAGIESTSAGNTALVRNNTVDHNENGIVVADGSVEIRGNHIDNNTWGVAILDKSPRAIVRDNKITNSADGGIRLVKKDDLVVKGNTVTGNRMAPFIVDHADDSLDMQKHNSFDSGRKGAEWVYEPLRSIAELADLTPVPSEFFSQPNVEYLLPVEQGGIR